ncbi:DNA-binding SARP family transcriptional activator/predicted negative regulator of RcsB-dependent stress response [Kibdelosporangium banguiense]|uniref:DNA-binding SARP family transcriptional activator/predicted negative regulator of RcsB-dependent stress response n=1 Tax=Kibdelosporangium banguiense TaxID=1365924 RepID=A0ABS4TA51_9PSEU|nr:BTAD domain-containing putative transcriptional regulator [Kibdelosporangium banguiense]MBP2321283.1 DNA-binding SARP family transcriptional activator/predicted negative regulator of RcsB-dependent stress response [Kibdelosporangium banguiense]
MSTGDSDEDDHAVIRFGVLGPVQAVVNGEPVALGGPGVRGLLAMLLLRPNEVVPVEDILDGLWGEDPPLTARTIVQNYVSRLRRQLRLVDPTGSVWIDTRLPGYQLIVDEDLIDVSRATALLSRARHEHPVRRAELLREALGLWRGPVLADVSPRINAPELEDLRFAVLEARIEADLELGRHAELVGELSTFAESYPFREQMIAHLVLALYRAGRRADALEAYQRFARRAAEDLGIDPGPALRELHERVLNDDSTLLLPAPVPVVAPKVGVLVPAQLPPAPVGFHGRDEELAWLDGLLAEDHGEATPIGVISGQAGIGKTALAALWGRRVAREFPDGQLFAGLRGFQEPLDPGEVLSQFLLTLGVPAGEVPADPDDRAALYRSLLAHRRVLVMLDDARDSEQVRLLLPGGSRALVLITSRVRLEGMVARSGARLLELRTLSGPAAVRVVDFLTGPGRIDSPRLERLATLCGCLPLALRIVGARLASRQEWIADELISDLSDERTRLQALEVEHSDTSVRAALDVTYRGLAEPAAADFRLLGLVPGPWIGPAVLAAMQQTDLTTARRGLRTLAGAFMVTETSQDVFVMHDLVRLYAKQSAPFGGAAFDRLVGYYLGAADKARRLLRPVVDPVSSSVENDILDISTPGQALAWFEREWTNLVAVIDAADPRSAWRLARMAHDYRAVRSTWEEWHTVVHKGLSAAVSAGEKDGEAWLLQSRCALYARFGRASETAGDASRVLRLALELGDDRLIAVGHEALASAYFGLRRYEEALAGYAKALAVDAHPAIEAHVRNNIAQVQRALGRLQEAVEPQRRAVELYREVGEVGFAAFAVGNLAELHAELNDTDQAERHARTAIELSVNSGLALCEAFGREVLGKVLSARGAKSGARQQWERSAELYTQVSSARAEQIRVLIDDLASGV